MLVLMMPKYGSAGVGLNVNNFTVDALSIDTTAPYSATATATVSFLNDGRLSYAIAKNPNPGGPTGTFYRDNEWLLQEPVATTVADDYEIRATLLSGATLSSGTMGSWLNLGTSRVWSNTATRAILGATTRSSLVRFEIGLAGASTALVSCDVTITATAEATA